MVTQQQQLYPSEPETMMAMRLVREMLTTRYWTLASMSAYWQTDLYYRYNANVIADNTYSQCDDESRRHAMLQESIDHKKDKMAIDITHGYTLTQQGRRIPKTTIKGWKLLCQWRDGSSDWIDLKHVKDSYPIQIAEYAVANRIQEEPVFKWWVPETLRACNRIIAKVKSWYWTSHKYGMKLHHSVQEALQIDKETGT